MRTCLPGYRRFMRLGAAQRQQHHKAQRTLVHAPAFLIQIGQGLQLRIPPERFAQLHALAAAQGAKHLRRTLRQQLLHRLRHLHARGKASLHPVNGYTDHDDASSRILTHPQRAYCS